MSQTINQTGQDADWNVILDRWLTVMMRDATVQTLSPIEALQRAGEIRCIALASPLDLFAAKRFLLTLFYWKADTAGGLPKLREHLLKGKVPRAILDAIKDEAHQFKLFDPKRPFLQDCSVQAEKAKSAGSLFAEYASGTNIAHFHHGDDKEMRLCLSCATMGMLRLIPWTQSGGQGLSPSIHNAPPIVAIACGANLAITLGLNLIPLSVNAGKARWTGHFIPKHKDTVVPYLEALTWNPRRVHLVSAERTSSCWGCGRGDVTVVGPIVYRKNEETRKRADKQPFEWQDPAAFYSDDALYTTMKSYSEELAANGRDLTCLLNNKHAINAAVVTTNIDHDSWCLIVPCTDPANNKTFDHRSLEIQSISLDSIRSHISFDRTEEAAHGSDGWKDPRRSHRNKGASRFVIAAASLLTHADWNVLLSAAYCEMHECAGAFDILSGLLWSLRGKIAGLPSRNVAWLVLKLMASVPAPVRIPHAKASFNPLWNLPKRQLKESRRGQSCQSIYPVSLPRGRRLEAELRNSLDIHIRQRVPAPIDWINLCENLDQLID